jgi:hypothetical protein
MKHIYFTLVILLSLSAVFCIGFLAGHSAKQPEFFDLFASHSNRVQWETLVVGFGTTGIAIFGFIFTFYLAEKEKQRREILIQQTVRLTVSAARNIDDLLKQEKHDEFEKLRKLAIEVCDIALDDWRQALPHCSLEDIPLLKCRGGLLAASLHLKNGGTNHEALKKHIDDIFTATGENAIAVN